MKRLKIVAVSAAATVAFLALGYWLLLWSASRKIEEIDWTRLNELLVAPLAAAATSAVVGSGAPSEVAVVSPSGAGVALANRSQEEARLAARRANTYLHALEVGREIASIGPGTPVPSTSAAMRGLDHGLLLDGWGHPFCLETAGPRVAVISPGAERFAECSAVRVSPMDVGRLSAGRLYLYPSGALVVVAEQAH